MLIKTSTEAVLNYKPLKKKRRDQHNVLYAYLLYDNYERKHKQTAIADLKYESSP